MEYGKKENWSDKQMRDEGYKKFLAFRRSYYNGEVRYYANYIWAKSHFVAKVIARFRNLQLKHEV